MLRGFTVLSEFLHTSSRTIYKKVCTEKNGATFAPPSYCLMHHPAAGESFTSSVVFHHVFHKSGLKN